LVNGDNYIFKRLFNIFIVVYVDNKNKKLGLI